MIDDLVELGTMRITRNFPLGVIVEAQAVLAADAGLRGLVALANYARNDGVVTPDDGEKALERFTEGPEGEHAVFNEESQKDEGLRLLREYLRAHPRDEATEKELGERRAEGYVAGLRAFAWWKDGVQYVGTSGTTLAEAIEKGTKDA